MNIDFFSVDRFHLLGGNATHPIEESRINPSAGMATILTTGSPLNIRPRETLHNGMPRGKLAVPSMAMTQRRAKLLLLYRGILTFRKAASSCHFAGACNVRSMRRCNCAAAALLPAPCARLSCTPSQVSQGLRQPWLDTVSTACAMSIGVSRSFLVAIRRASGS